MSNVLIEWTQESTHPKQDTNCLFMLTNDMIISGIYTNNTYIPDITSTSHKVRCWCAVEHKPLGEAYGY